jgi:drug/metabolite transporter (DMT)-like permease
MIVLLSVLSAFVFGSGVVLQRRAAMEEPEDQAARPGLLVRLVGRPLWLLGLGADVGGFALQAAALSRGSLVVVQPLVTTSLLFTFVFISFWYHEPISAGEWAAMLLVMAGLSTFLIVASPSEESAAIADMRGWLLCSSTVIVLAVIAVGGGFRARGPARAAFFGVAAGIADAFMAVLAKAFAGSWDRGLLSLFRSWMPYALIVGGLAALLLVSTAYQAGNPTVSLPIITVADPLVGSLVGISLFGEQLTLGGLRAPGMVLALLAMGIGLVALGRSSRVARAMVPDGSTGVAAPT